MTEVTGVNKLVRDHAAGVDWMRVENVATPGTPDLQGCYLGREAWVESKLIRSGNKIHFQPTQPAWIIHRTSCGSRVFILVRRGDELRLWPGDQMGELLSRGWIAPGLVWCAFSVRGADWKGFRKVVFGVD